MTLLKVLPIAFLVATFSARAFDQSLFIENPEVLKALEGKGFHFASWFSQPQKSISNQNLYTNSLVYRSMVNSISKDLEAVANSDPRSSVTMAKAHRLFNKKWLRSKAAHYELVGIINRLDRRDFFQSKCGEIRFIYRLAYKIKRNKDDIRSRLPLTFNVVTFVDKSECQNVAQQWFQLRQKHGDQLVKGLLIKDGPLKTTLNLNNLKSFELNLQAVRWPSTIRPDMGGYAEYFLRVFTPSPKGIILAPLENTPDVTKLIQDKSLKVDLLNWLQKAENLKKLDEGTLVVPNRYLAKKATSVALHGRARLFNKPYSRIFKESEFKGVDFKKYKTLKSPYSLLKRLNDLSCAGCHQGRTVAGFHFLGKDRSDVLPANSILSSFSSHFLNDQERRKDYLKKVFANQTPDEFRSYSVRSPSEKGTWGAHCSLDKDPAFKTWTCEKGLVCKAYDLEKHSPLGTCVEPSSASEGSPCRVGQYKPHWSPKKDKIVAQKELGCRDDLICETTRVGFPGGMCSGDCSQLGKNATCGSIAVLFGFNQCLAHGKAFDDCLANNIRPGSLRACDSQNPCRDDYICAKTLKGKGGCIPPYFLFQLRVDGHPKPI